MVNTLILNSIKEWMWVYKNIMKFKQYENGSCDIKFSWKERIILFYTGKLHLSDEGLRHFGNYLIKLVAEWNLKFNKKIKKLETFEDTDIEGK